jgi:hypothetical protein
MLDTEMEDKHDFKIAQISSRDNFDEHLDGVPLPRTYDPKSGQPIIDEVMEDGHDFKVRA